MGALLHAQRMVGLDKNQFLRVPMGDRTTDPDGFKAVDKALGVPDAPEGYGDYKPATGELGLSTDAIAALNKNMHAAGATPAARNAALQTYHDVSAAQAQADETAYQGEVTQGMAKLKAEWGGQYEENLKAADLAAKNVLGQEFIDFLKSARVDDHPLVKAGFYKLAMMTAEDLPGVKTPPPSMSITPQEAQRQIAELEKNPALLDSSHIDHGRVVAERERLYGIAFPAG